MRRFLLLACGLLGLALPASASAAITVTRDANVLTSSITSPSTAGAVSGASFPEIPPSGNPAATSTTPLGGFPLIGDSYAILSSGNTALAQSDAQTNFAGASNGGGATAARGNAQDVIVLRVDLNVPAEANCLTVGFRFLSEEYPEFVGQTVNDGFIAQLDRSDWTGTGSGITAPGNFAFDDQGAVVSVNTMPRNTDGTALPAVTAEATGTIYDGATPRLSAAQAIPTPGPHTLYLSIFDQGDQNYDSAVFVDRVALVAAEPGTCGGGAQSDAPPSVTLGVSQSAPDDATPTLSGTAGNAPGDGNAVTVRVYAGGAAAGTPVQTLVATRSGGAWSVDAAALAPGTYTAQAAQSDVAGNTGLSAPATFTVARQQVVGPQDQSPVPVLGRSVVAGKVSGTVRIKTKRGKFRKLGANELIPLGSTVDATKGKVRITSAAGPVGATQSALFFQGAFVITQTGGSKPVTQLALSPKLSCASKGKKSRASQSAKKKKVRRLWGDGKGRFRTKGKHGAATVRGTKWLTQDSCDSTLVRVKRGTVAVRDFAKKKTVVVKKGKTYVARPGKKRP
jgi:hypothetical protein